MAELISVIVATYERPDALEAVLCALASQSDHDFEVVVADDGSGTETARVVKEWAAKMPVPLGHVWHDDIGFRLAEIRNRAIRVSRGLIAFFWTAIVFLGAALSPPTVGSRSAVGS